MYYLEDKLKKKYASAFEKLPPDFLERVRELDQVRNLQRPLEPYNRRAQPLAGKKESDRLYYILDASAVHHLYVIDDELTPKLDHFIEQRGLGKAFLFMPNFCVAETLNTLAKLHYRRGLLNVDQYTRCRDAFVHDIHNGQLIYNYELNRYHILYMDYIIPYEHLFEPQRPKGAKKGEEWTLSTLDMLIIAIGMELARITGGFTYIVTCDKRLNRISQILLALSKEERAQHEIPDYINFPHSIYLWDKRLVELPYVEGQKIDS